MRILVPIDALRHLMRWTERALLAAAVCLLSYCAFILADMWTFQQAELQNFQILLADRDDPAPGTSQGAANGAPYNSPPPKDEGMIGTIEILRLGVSVVVSEGTSQTTLRRAVGHISNTALPGHPGNVGIAGHRDTFFRPLRNIETDDIITLTTLDGQFSYRVVSIKIVDPYDVSVLDPSVDEVLTLVTCYPFFFVGSAPDRFIVRAERTAMEIADSF